MSTAHRRPRSPTRLPSTRQCPHRTSTVPPYCPPGIGRRAVAGTPIVAARVGRRRARVVTFLVKHLRFSPPM